MNLTTSYLGMTLKNPIVASSSPLSHNLESIRRLEDAGQVAGMFGHEASIDWNGETYTGHEAARFWVGKIAESHAGLVYGSIEGVSSREVRFTGMLSRRVEVAGENREVIEQATVELIWVFTSVQEFQIQRAVVGPWQRMRD